MEPMSDEQLDRFLATWIAPETPRDIEHQIFASRRPWWKQIFAKIWCRYALRRLGAKKRRRKGLA